MSRRPRDLRMRHFWFLEGPDALHMHYPEFRVSARERLPERGVSHALSTDGTRRS